MVVVYLKHVVDEVDESAGVDPFVVVPGEYFGVVVFFADGACAEAVDDG